MKGSRRAPDRDLLLARHAFPGEYIIKAFGPGQESFSQAVQACASDVVGDRFDASSRLSSGGNRMCVTLTLQAENVDEVTDVYERLHELPGLMLIL